MTEVPESAVSGFATHEEVESATSGAFPSSGVNSLSSNILNTATGIMVTYHGTKPDENAAIYAAGNTLHNVNSIGGSDLNVQSAQLFLRGTITAQSAGLTAGNLTANSFGLYAANLSANADGLSAAGISAINDSSNGGFTANGISANAYYSGFSANGISAGKLADFAIQGQGETFSSTYGNGFVFKSVNSGIGSARLTLASPNSVVQIYSPKFEAKNISGAGFSIEGSGARGYDQSGNVTWDTSKPAKLIGWNNYQGTAIDPRAAGINGGVIATVYPDVIPQSMQLSSAPYAYMDGYGFYAINTGNGTTISVNTSQSRISLEYAGIKSTATMDPGDVTYKKYNSTTSATDTWSLTGSVQKREIACDSATSAITAIAGSAIGGGSTYSAGDNIDITDDVISGKDWSEDIASATSGLQPSGDYYSATNPSGFMTELPASATDVIDAVTANSGAWGGNALPISARDGLDLEMSGDMLWIGASALNETLSGKQDTLTFEYNESSAISAINGSALAGGGGGGDVPEGVMAESGLGFNAVDEISGYNGSAFATLSPEKQWLVHDDTLVHAANSAQYALGVNLSAVAQLLGVDETVLFEGDAKFQSGTATLSEPYTNFKRIKVYGHTDDGVSYPWGTEVDTTSGIIGVGIATNNAGWSKWFYLSMQNSTAFVPHSGWVLTWGSTAQNSLSNWGISKVIGIGRKQ